MKHPRTHPHCEIFQYLTLRWCITQALELIEVDPTAAELIGEMDITEVDAYLDLTPAEPGKVRLFTVKVDKEYALTMTNLDQPILAVRLTNKDGEDLGDMVIDGWHRVYRARMEGRTNLPAHVLSAETERAVRIAVW